MSNIKFELGQMVVTRGAIELLDSLEITKLLSRHASGDWGELCDEDMAANDNALISGDLRIFSAYDTPKGRVWIITEHDRSYTTILLPHEY
jgi:hypothetical protein